MDIPRSSNSRANLTRLLSFVGAGFLLLAVAAFGLTRLRPAAPSVERSSIWTDEVKRGPMIRDVKGLGTLVPEENHARWIAALTVARVNQIVVHPGAVVTPDTVILELSNPELERDLLDAEYQLKAVQADYENLKVQVQSDLLNQRALAAAVRSEYEQAKIQHEADQQLVNFNVGAAVTEKLSRVKEQQLGIRTKLEEERAKNAENAAVAKLQAQQSRVEQQKALYGLRRSQHEALHVRAGIHGVLQLVPVEVGQSVAPGANLARVADPHELKAEIKIPETQAKDVALGQKATIDTRNGLVNGHVSRVDPSVQNGTVKVDVAIDGPLPRGARPDLSVDGTIELEKLVDVLYVARPVQGQPESTISLFKLVEGGAEAIRVKVLLGRGSASAMEVRDGLRIGDKVILSDTSPWDNFERIRLK